MRLGLATPIVQQVPARAQPWERDAGPNELVRFAQAADRLGFAWVTCSDHVAVPRSHVAAMGAVWYEPVATLAFLAAHTVRVQLLSHVLVLSYRHPLHVAKAFATLDRLSDGRVLLGVGSGHLKAEFRSLGVSYEGRGRQADEALRALRIALAEECSSFAGEYASWREMLVAPRPVHRPHPPIWVGGNGGAAVRRAASFGDGWIPWQIDLEEFGRRVQQLHRLRARGAADLIIVAPMILGAAAPVREFRAQVETWSSAGATAFHVGVESYSFAHLLERLEELSAVC